MSISRNSAPQDFTICGRPGTRNSQPKAPNTGWPLRIFFFTGLLRIVFLSGGARHEAPGARLNSTALLLQSLVPDVSCLAPLRLRVEFSLPFRSLQHLGVDDQVRLATVGELDRGLERAL